MPRTVSSAGRALSTSLSTRSRSSFDPALPRTTTGHSAQIRLAPEDNDTYPSLTSRGLPTNAFQEETATGLVSASSVEDPANERIITQGGFERRSSITLGGTSSAHSPHGEKTPAMLEKGGKEGIPQPDVKLVTWLENDPDNPRNYSTTKKWVCTLIVSLLCFNSGFASAIITGGIPEVATAFSTSEEIVNASVCLFVVGFGIGPLAWAPLSEIYGRRIIYLISSAAFVLLTIPCALANSISLLIVFRLLSGIAASAPMTNAAGTIADVWSVNTRGFKMALFSSVLFASPCIGPLVGGFIVMNTTWRWMYYVLLFSGGICFFVAYFFLPESYAPTLLGWRAKDMRKATGDLSIMTEQERNWRPTSEIISEALLRPLIMLTTEVIMIAFSGYLCLIYGLLYGFFFAYPIVFQQGHNFSPGETGLTFLGILIGIIIVLTTAIPVQEMYYQRKVLEGDGAAEPESRLPLMMGGAILLPISLFIFAWTSAPSTSWVGPAVSGIPFGFSLVGIYISANSYLVDAYGGYGASAMAAKTFIRSMAGASMPMWIPYMYARLGNEWSGSLMAFVAVGMAPIPFVFFWYGKYIRGLSSRATS